MYQSPHKQCFIGRKNKLFEVSGGGYSSIVPSREYLELRNRRMSGKGLTEELKITSDSITKKNIIDILNKYRPTTFITADLPTIQNDTVGIVKEPDMPLFEPVATVEMIPGLELPIPVVSKKKRAPKYKEPRAKNVKKALDEVLLQAQESLEAPLIAAAPISGGAASLKPGIKGLPADKLKESLRKKSVKK